MSNVYWLLASCGALFVGWAHCHTDEIPVMLGFVLIFGTMLGAVAPSRFLISWLIAGAPLFVVETLVHFSLIQAPYPASTGLPFAALFAYVPAAMGVGLGAGARKMLAA